VPAKINPASNRFRKDAGRAAKGSDGLFGGPGGSSKPIPVNLRGGTPMPAEDGCGSSSSSHSWKSYGIKKCYSPPVATSRSSTWFASAAFFAEIVYAIACHRDLQRAVVSLEQIESFPEIAPKRQQFRLI